jgi:hypothetical protein
MKTRLWLCLIAGIFFSSALGALEISQGRVRLCLHENTGRFTLYYLDEAEGRREPFFSDQDPRTTFVALNVDDRIFRLGESIALRMGLEEGTAPAFVFESAALAVRQEFSFIKTAGSSVSNGVQIRVQVKNLLPKQINAGLRFLIDTHLGEKSSGAPFLINKRGVVSETLVAGENERWWVSRNESLSIMGSIFLKNGGSPDYVHFANWKRLNETPWKCDYIKGRNFNYLPYSVGDSAVCYYYDPAPVSANGELTFTIMLAAEDPAGFEETRLMPVLPERPNNAQRQNPPYSFQFYQDSEFPVDFEWYRAAGNSKEADLALLASLIERLDMYINGKIEISENELTSIELTISLLKARYNFP